MIEYSNIGIFAPISNPDRDYPLYVSIVGKDLETTGKVLLDQLVTIDFDARGYQYIETFSSAFTQELLLKTKAIFDKD